MIANLQKKWKESTQLREWVESLVIAFILAMFIRTFFVQAFKIPSGSMRMTLIEGDRLMVNKMRYGPKIPFTKKRIPGYAKPQRGDVIVFIYPQDKSRDFIKRLIAFGGETVEIRNGAVWINGRLDTTAALQNRYYYNMGMYGQAGQPVKVPPGFVFVMGDNSQSSHDSRFWGFLPEENILGRAEGIYWPLNRIKWLN
ncbi:MAG: signal peptidase I [Candidatus Omnitrophica bacterium]|nr:signal peptidase I [Candidatus Omnitrophota bacterium]